MTLPQAVIFDLGKVLLDFDYGKAARRLAARSDSHPEMIQKIIDQTPLLFRFETGLITRDEFYAKLRAETGFKGDQAEFADIFGDIFEPIEPMIRLHAALRKKRVRTYIFSNTNDLAIDHIRKTFPFFGSFDGYIFSYEHRAMKPSPGIYEAVERETKLTGDQLLYIDDRHENIAEGAKRGWQIILQEDPQKTLLAVKKTGLLD